MNARTALPLLLVAGAVIWPVVLGVAWAQRVRDRDAPGGHLWPAMVYLAASRVCHQRPARSFATAGVGWPVCARCSGLYLAAPLGAVAAWRRRRRPRRLSLDRWRAWLVGAAVPTVMTLAIEWLRLAPMGNGLRFVAALPLGAVIASALVDVAGRADSIG